MEAVLLTFVSLDPIKGPGSQSAVGKNLLKISYLTFPEAQNQRITLRWLKKNFFQKDGKMEDQKTEVALLNTPPDLSVTVAPGPQRS